MGSLPDCGHSFDASWRIAAIFMLLGAGLHIARVFVFGSDISFSWLVTVGGPIVGAIWVLVMEKKAVTPRRHSPESDPRIRLSRRLLFAVSIGAILMRTFTYFDSWPINIDPVVLAVLLPLTLLGPAWITTVPYLLAARLMPYDIKNTLIWLTIGIGLNLLPLLSGRWDWSVLVELLTVIIPGIIAFTLYRTQGASPTTA